MRDIGRDFRALHRRGDPFILANAWDVGSARMLAGLGAKAIGTSSSAHGFVLGHGDGVSRDQALTHAAELAATVNVPVSGDFENGFGEAPETCAETVRLAFEAGLAGISIEDTSLPGSAPYDFDLAVDRIRAAASAARALPRDFVLVARADGIMLGSYGIDEALARLAGFDAAGADCLYAPLPATMADQARIVASTQKPVNVLIAGAYAEASVADYARMGAARLSLGGSLARAAQRVILDAGRAMFEAGSFTPLTRSVPGAEVDRLMAQGAAGRNGGFAGS